MGKYKAMKEKFQLADRINAEKRLKFGHKALLNQAISFQLGNQKFHATDNWLADHWGESTQVIKKIIKELKSYGLIFCELKRYKHTEGGKNWYNKRYITVNIDQLNNFLDGADTRVPKSEMEDIILPDAEIGNSFEASESFFCDNYPIENNNSRMRYDEKSAGEVQEIAVETTIEHKPKALDFDEFRVIELIAKHPNHLGKLCEDLPNIADSISKGEFTHLQIQHLKSFHEAMLMDEKLKNEYRGIQPIEKKEALL